MPTIRNGALATGGATAAINSDQLIVDMLGEVYEYDPESSPLLTIVQKKANVRKAEATTVKHLEDEPVPEWDKINAGGGYGTGVTAFVVDNPSYFRAGHLVRVMRTDEVVRVTGVDTGISTIYVTRAWAGTATALVDNDDLLILGAAEMEGDLSPTAKQTITTTKTNYTQILKTPAEVTRTMDDVGNYGGSERLRQRRKAGAKHARDWEQILIWGRKKEDTSNFANPVRSAGGLDEHISTNVLTASGPLTEATFTDFVGDCMRYSVMPGKKRKTLIMSREVSASISQWASGKIQTNSAAKATYGIEVSTLITPFGTVDLVLHPLLEVGGAGTAFLIDTDGIFRRPLMDTKLHTNIQANGQDTYKDEYVTEQSFSFALEKAFGRIDSVTF